MTHADLNDLETRDYIFKIGDRGKGIQARYDENTDALIFPRAAFDYVYKLLKEALSQEPTIGQLFSCEEVEELRSKIWKQVEQEPKWIPISERLPEEGTYLVAIKRFDGTTTTDIMSFAKDLNKVDEFDFPKHKSGWYNYDSEFGYYENTDVKAWMPLPKPYEPQE